MRRYRLSGLVLESNVLLPELPPASGNPSFVFELADRASAPARPRWYHHWKDGRRRWLSFARTPAGYLLRFPSLVDFELSRLGAGEVPRIRARPRTRVPTETLRHLLLDQVWPLVLSGSGRFVIHASAVALPDGRAVAFAGPAGAGKSSLAASMARGGCRLVSDDCLLLERSRRGWKVVPSYPGVRLWPDMVERIVPEEEGVSDVAHYTTKKRLAGSLPFATRAVPLAAMFLVHPRGPRARVAAAPLTGASALMALVPFTYLLDCEAREQVERSFAGLAALAASVPLVRLDVPHAARRLAEVADLVARRLTSPSSS